MGAIRPALCLFIALLHGVPPTQGADWHLPQPSLFLNQVGFTSDVFAEVDQAIGQDDYDLALDLLDSIRSAARAGDNGSLQEEVLDRMKEVRQLKAQFAKISEAAETLEQSPDDQVANRIVGLFRCMQRADWEAGLSLLAKCDDEMLQALATADLANPAEASEQLKLAQQWWAYADDEPARERRPFELRARHWYLLARPNLSISERADAERRLDRLPLFADRILIWNQHNWTAQNRGTTECVVTVVKDGKERFRKVVALPWSGDSPAWLVLRTPHVPIDQIRVEVTKFRGFGGGLAEIEVYDGETNIARNCSAVAVHYFEDNPYFHPRKLTDGDTSGHQDGMWLLNNSVTGWAVVDLIKHREQP
jgi:hypothetical protein